MWQVNIIFMCGQNYGAISNRIEANLHKHWMLQIFISVNEKLTLHVEGQQISCRAIIVNVNTAHAFYSENALHFTMLIDPTSQLGRNLRMHLLKDRSFYILEDATSIEFQGQLLDAIEQWDSNQFMVFIKNMICYFDQQTSTQLDQRIEDLIELINACDCEDPVHLVKDIAKTINISESRLSHLFKKETGMTLKSYIVLHKLQRTYQMLFKGESITTAAVVSGFDSASHFASANKKMTGMTARGILEDSKMINVDL